MTLVILLSRQTLLYAVPLLLIAQGGLFSQRGGIGGLALPGFALSGALASLWILGLAAPYMGVPGRLILSAGAAMAAGALMAGLYALATACLRGEQTVCAMGLNLLAWALARRALPGLAASAFQALYAEQVPLLGGIPVLGPILFQNVPASLYLALLACAVSAGMLRRSRLGLRLRACGDNPESADVSGVAVGKTRALGVLISGCLAGLGGSALAASLNAPLDAAWIGQGLLALAVLAAGRRRSLRMIPAALFIGFVQAGAQTGLGLGETPLPEELRGLLPYVAALPWLAAAAHGSERDGPMANGLWNE